MMTVELLSVLFSCDINVLLPELTNTVFFGSFINNTCYKSDLILHSTYCVSSTVHMQGFCISLETCIKPITSSLMLYHCIRT